MAIGGMPNKPKEPSPLVEDNNGERQVNFLGEGRGPN